MTEIHVVMKPFSDASGLLSTGSVVNATGWRNLSRLVSQRYLRPATEAEAATLSEKPENEKVTVKNKGVKPNGN